MMRSFRLGVNANVVKPVDFHGFVNRCLLGGDQRAAVRQHQKGDLTAPLRILLLEDDASDAELIQQLLEADRFICEVIRVQTRAEFLRALEEVHIDLILADYKLASPTADQNARGA